MSKTVFRYFFDFLDGQERWLNEMAGQGWRLKKCGRLRYVFEECGPGEYEYAMEFVGDRAYARAKEYRLYLEGFGFRTFTKSINLNFSFGKVKWRPYAKGLGQIAVSPGGYNKELLILEKKRDGKPFELHTDLRDQLAVYKTVRRAYVWAVLSMLGLAAVTFVPGASTMPAAWIWALRGLILFLGIVFAIPAMKYSGWLGRLKAQSKIFE